MAKHYFKVIFLCLNLFYELLSCENIDYFDGEIEDLNQDIVLTSVPGSVIRFTIIPHKNDPDIPYMYTFKVFEGSSLSKELLLVENENFTPSEKEISFTSHHHQVRLFGEGNIAFGLKYRYIPKQTVSLKEIEFGKGELSNIDIPSLFSEQSVQFSNFVNDRQEIILKIPGSPFVNDVMNNELLYDPEHLMTTIDTGNGRIGLLTTPVLHLGLRKIGTKTTLRLITGTQSRQIFKNGELCINVSYDLGDSQYLSTILPTTPNPFPSIDSSSFTLYFMSINEKEFYETKFVNLKSKLRELLAMFSKDNSSYNTNCELQFDPPKGFRQCRRDCSLSEHSESNGCGSISLAVKQNVADCPVYSTQDFQEKLHTSFVEDLSTEFKTDIRINNCLYGTKTIMITSAIPIFVVLIIFAILYFAKPVKSIVSYRLMKTQRNKGLDSEKKPNGSNILSNIGKENNVFFEEWPAKYSEDVTSTNF
ncbi:uncharacterized protein [Lepeophtheirus salmonis]|uniref:uncharacterized protein n=1 Tax=Lepeophtheirus salmonis TaxID=72036 RepID=UPI001AE6C517|nr:uncharacterized protein LOC121120256 [Lepeophtheirus salmonis]